MSPPVRSKKMAVRASRAYPRPLDISSGKWSASTSWQIEFSGWTAASCWPDWAPRPWARRCRHRRPQGRPSLTLQAKAGILALRPGQAGYPDMVARTARRQTPLCASSAATSSKSRFANDLPAPRSLNWRGIDGVAAAEPLVGAAARWRRAPRKTSRFHCVMPAPSCATSLCSATARRGRPGAAADRRRKRAGRRRPRRGFPDRGLAASRRTEPRSRPASIPTDTTPFYTVNGQHDAGYHGACP